MGKKGKNFAEELLSKGFIELTNENAKIYGDSFVLEEIDRKDRSTKVPTKNEIETGIQGSQYIANIVDSKHQEKIDFDEEEFEQSGINVKTPLMQKQENTKNIFILNSEHEDKISEKNTDEQILDVDDK